MAEKRHLVRYRNERGHLVWSVVSGPLTKFERGRPDFTAVDVTDDPRTNAELMAAYSPDLYNVIAELRAALKAQHDWHLAQIRDDLAAPDGLAMPLTLHRIGSVSMILDDRDRLLVVHVDPAVGRWMVEVMNDSISAYGVISAAEYGDSALCKKTTAALAAAEAIDGG